MTIPMQPPPYAAHVLAAIEAQCTALMAQLDALRPGSEWAGTWYPGIAHGHLAYAQAYLRSWQHGWCSGAAATTTGG